MPALIHTSASSKVGAMILSLLGLYLCIFFEAHFHGKVFARAQKKKNTQRLAIANYQPPSPFCVKGFQPSSEHCSTTLVLSGSKTNLITATSENYSRTCTCVADFLKDTAFDWSLTQKQLKEEAKSIPRPLPASAGDRSDEGNQDVDSKRQVSISKSPSPAGANLSPVNSPGGPREDPVASVYRPSGIRIRPPRDRNESMETGFSRLGTKDIVEPEI